MSGTRHLALLLVAALLGLLIGCGVRGSPHAPRPVDPTKPAPPEPCVAGCCRQAAP